MHTKTIIAAIGLIISIGGWNVWNLLLSGTFTATYRLYQIRRAFIDNFGHTLNFWALSLVILGACLVLELLVNALRRVYFANDVDLLQRIERQEKKDAKRAKKGLGARHAEDGQREQALEDLPAKDTYTPGPGQASARTSQQYLRHSPGRDGARTMTPASELREEENHVDPFEKGYGPTKKKTPLSIVTRWNRGSSSHDGERRGENGVVTSPIELRTPPGEDDDGERRRT